MSIWYFLYRVYWLLSLGSIILHQTLSRFKFIKFGLAVTFGRVGVAFETVSFIFATRKNQLPYRGNVRLIVIGWLFSGAWVVLFEKIFGVMFHDVGIWSRLKDIHHLKLLMIFQKFNVLKLMLYFWLLFQFRQILFLIFCHHFLLSSLSLFSNLLQNLFRLLIRP